jgi:hypothetical protein
VRALVFEHAPTRPPIPGPHFLRVEPVAEFGRQADLLLGGTPCVAATSEYGAERGNVIRQRASTQALHRYEL